MDKSGRTEAALTLTGATARDWEDMSSGPNNTLWIGDIGDNPSTRTNISVYRVTEPTTLRDGPIASTKFTFKYPDGAHNAEALMVHPATGRVLIATKSASGGAIYQGPSTLSSSGVNALTKVASGTPKSVTAGAYFPDGKRFVLRQQNVAHIYAGIGATPQQIRLPEQLQGESVTVEPGGAAILVGSERPNSPVHRVPVGPGSSGPASPAPTTASPVTTKPVSPAPTSSAPASPTGSPTTGTPTTGTPTTGTPTTGTGGFGPVIRSAPSGAFVTPDQFGAIGDGVANDTAAVQKALSASAGKTLFLPAGKTYLSTSSLTIPARDTTIVGAGPSSVLKWSRSFSTTSTGASLRTPNGGANLVLSNFVLDGGGPGVPSGLNSTGIKVPGIRLTGVDGFSIKNLEVRNSVGIGITYHGSRNGVIQSNNVHNTGRDGITGYASGTADIVVDSNLVTNVGDDALAINGLTLGGSPSTLPTRIKITNNVVRGWDPNGLKLGRGIAINGANDVMIQNNKISEPHGTGILSMGCTPRFCPAGTQSWNNNNISILNNTIDRASGGSRPGGIFLVTTQNSRVSGNVITNTTPAIVNDGCTNCTIG